MLYYSPTINIIENSKRVQFEGRDTIIAPVVLMVEGVHNGSSGPLFYSAKELELSASFWNGMPVPVYHPKDVAGLPISCNSPDVMNAYCVGRLYNVVYSDQPTPRLKGDVYVDVSRATNVNACVLDMLVQNKPLEVSTGLFSTDEVIEGIWNTEKYSAIVRDIRPDHLALLPELKGACSWEDGCGIRANTEKGGLYMADEKKGTLLDRIVSWLSGEYIKANSEEKVEDVNQIMVNITKQKEEIKESKREEVFMERKEKVTALIANGHFVEDDRKFLENCECPQFTKIEALAAKQDVSAIEMAKCKELMKGNAEVKPVTFEELLAAAPAEVKAQHEFVANQIKERKAGLVAQIKANESNKITDERLSRMDMETLAEIAGSIVPVVNYAGAQGSRFVDAGEQGEAPMVVPVINFEKK